MGARAIYHDGLTIFGVGRRFRSFLCTREDEIGEIVVSSINDTFDFSFSGRFQSEQLEALIINSQGSVSYDGSSVDNNSFVSLCKNIPAYIRSREGDMGNILFDFEYSFSS